MKVGLLQCDHVADHLQPISGDYPEMFRKLLPEIDLQVYDVIQNQFPASVDECEAYLTTGSKYSVYDDLPWIHRLKALVQEIHDQQKYFIGVCFGHQLLAEALGGQVLKGDTGWCVGIHPFTIVAQESWMVPFRNPVQLLMSCQDQVQVMPENARLLAKSPDCPVAMFGVGHRMLGIQGHPEFPREYARALMIERAAKIGQEKTEKGLASLEQMPDAMVVAQWMMHFLKGGWVNKV